MIFSPVSQLKTLNIVPFSPTVHTYLPSFEKEIFLIFDAWAWIIVFLSLEKLWSLMVPFWENGNPRTIFLVLSEKSIVFNVFNNDSKEYVSLKSWL